jgi:hypothetical protein
MNQSRGPTQKTKDECTLYVTVKGSKLPDDVGKMHLWQHFQEFNSSITDVELVRKKGKHYAFIKFTSGGMATAAMQSLQGSMLQGAYLLTINYGQKTVPATQPPVVDAGRPATKSSCSPVIHHDLRSSDTEREVPLQLPFEQLLYLKHCFFVSPTPLSTALMGSLPAKLVLKHECIMLYGTSVANWKTTSLICGNPLVCNLKSSCYTETWGHAFVYLLQDSFLNLINETNKDILCIVRNKREVLQHDLMFTVYIFSHDQETLHATMQKLTVSLLYTIIFSMTM